MLNIIIPLYNNKDNIINCLESLVNQTKKMFIVTIIQDYDNQNYEEIINNFNKKININFIKNNNNLGPGLTRQRGIDLNRMCDYIMFLDSDDMLNPKAVEALYNSAKFHDADMVCSKIIIERNHKTDEIHCPLITDAWLHGRIYKYKFLIDNDIRFSTKGKYNEDVGFNLQATRLAKKIFYLDQETYIFRDNINSITRKDSYNFHKKAIPDMIAIYLESILKIIKKIPFNDELVANCLNTLYYNYQVNNFLGNNNKIYNNDIKYLLTHPKVVNFLKNKNKYSKLVMSMKLYYYIDNKTIIAIKQSFDEWYKEIVEKEI